MGTFNDTPIWIVRKNKQRSKTFKYVYIKSAKELLKHIPLAVDSLSGNKVKVIIHLPVVGECSVVCLYIFGLCFKRAVDVWFCRTQIAF